MKKIILLFCLLIVFSAVFFFLGQKYQQRKFEKMRGQFFNRDFQAQPKRPGAAGMRAEGFQRGEIISRDEKTITLKLENGNQRIVSIDEKTQFLRGEPISLEDIKSGQKVMILGKEISSDIFGANLVLLLPSE